VKKKFVKAKRSASARKADRLPSAPLAEVVFELHWALVGEDQSGVLPYDPMLIPLLQRFSDEMEKLGFHHVRDIVRPPQTGPHGVVRRFWKREDLPFPLMQIGAGIFAVNESSRYEWHSFRDLVLRGVRTLIDSYPTTFGASLRPSYLELRYVDVFDKTVLKSNDFFDFAHRATTLKFTLPRILEDKQLFWGDPIGRFLFQRGLRGYKNSQFVVDLASAQESKFQLLSKVSTSTPSVPSLKSKASFIADVRKWLEFAHGITSPFFKDFVLPEVMKKFQ
jgi:uncharacterized protein (TIGR04255 family)